MDKKWKSGITAATALALSSVFMVGLTACGNKDDSSGNNNLNGTHTYRTYLPTTPSNWNLFTQEDANDREVSDYLNSAFFEFDFKFDEKGEIIPGGFEVEYSAATNLEDVTKDYAGEYGIPESAVGNRAWKLTLRNDLKWNDGTLIKANDFVYSMEELLDYNFMNRLASQYYGANMVLHNAREYLYSGQSVWSEADGPYSEYNPETLDEKIIFTLGNPTDNKDKYGGAVCSMRGALGFPANYTAADVAEYLVANYLTTLTKDQVLALEGKKMSEIKANESLKATWDSLIGWWQTEPNEELDFFVTYYTYPEVAFEEVGIKAVSDNELVVVFDNTFNLLDENGNLTYEAAYYFQDLPLIKKDLYEACKKAPVEGSTLWTSNYNTTLETTASWGPYMLTEYQAGTTYTLSKNKNWYGYGMDKYEGQYETDQIVCRTIPEWNTAWLKFQNGEIDGIGIDPTIASDYKTSERAYFTPDDLVASIHIQSSRDALEKRQEAGINKTILMQPEFRKALSLALDRDAYAQSCTTSSLAGLGYFNSMHYYDVANGGVYRETEVAKKALLRAYGAEELDNGKWKVGNNTYDNVSDAEAALTGYNLTLAKELVTSAYNKALAAGDIKATDKVSLVFGTSEESTSTRRHFEFLTKAWTELMKGTPLEGRFETKFDPNHGNNWATDFQNGQYDIAPASGFSGGAWNPYYMIGAEVNSNESIRYCHGWDTTKESFEFTMTGGEGQESVTDTLSIQDWYDSLNGLEGGTYNFSLYPTDSRLALVAELELHALESYWDIPTFYAFSASLISYKVDYITYEYNTFMGYGGIQYMTYNYDDASWESYVKSQGGRLDYKA